MFGSARIPDPADGPARTPGLARLGATTRRRGSSRGSARSGRWRPGTARAWSAPAAARGSWRRGAGGRRRRAASRSASTSCCRTSRRRTVYGTPDLSFNFHYFAIRKMHFLMRAQAIAVFPGGFGTFDELFEVLTLVQSGRMRRLPILLFGEAFWRAGGRLGGAGRGGDDRSGGPAALHLRRFRRRGRWS